MSGGGTGGSTGRCRVISALSCAFALFLGTGRSWGIS